MNPVIGKRFHEYNPQAWHDYVKSMKRHKALTADDSRAAVGIKLSKRKDGTFTVRTTRTAKTATNIEITAVAKEFGFEVEELWTALTARGWVLTNEAGEILNATTKRTRAPRKPKTTQGDADHLEASRRTQEGADQLFFTGAHPDVPEESPVLSTDEPQEG